MPLEAATHAVAHEVELCEAADWERYGGFLIFAIIAAYTAGGIALVRDRALFHAARGLVKRQNEPIGVALVALIAHVPHLIFAAIVSGIFRSDVGEGFVAGSAMFSLVAGVGAVSIAAKGGAFLLSWSGIARDISFLLVASIIATGFAQYRDGRLWGLEVSLLIVGYIAYVVWCVCEPMVVKAIRRRTSERTPLLLSSRRFDQSQRVCESEEAGMQGATESPSGEEYRHVWMTLTRRPPSVVGTCCWVVSLPLLATTSLLLPNLCYKDSRTTLRLVWGLAMSLIMTLFLSLVVSVCAHRIACAVSFSPSSMGVLCSIFLCIPQLAWQICDSMTEFGADAVYEILRVQVPNLYVATALSRIARLGRLGASSSSTTVLTTGSLALFLLTSTVTFLRFNRQVGALYLLLYVLLLILVFVFDKMNIHL